MDLFEELQTVAARLETVALNGCQTSLLPNEKDNSPTDILRMKNQMTNQCFEMTIKIGAEKIKRCEEQEAEGDMSEYEQDIEEAKTNHSNKTLALHRMQIWWAISEKLEMDDPEAEALKAAVKHNMDLSSKIIKLQRESCEIQDQVFQLQKQRLDVKRLIHEKMNEIEELMRMREHPAEGKYKKVLEKGQSNLEKYQKMAAITQNVLRGAIMASKVNWREDPKLKDIALELEGIPNSD